MTTPSSPLLASPLLDPLLDPLSGPLLDPLSGLLIGHDDAPALHDGDRVVSRAALRQGAAQAARGLQQLGLRRGDAVAVWLPNGAAWLQLLWAAARLGVLVVPVSTRYKAPESAHLLTVSRARLLVFGTRFLDQGPGAVAQRELLSIMVAGRYADGLRNVA